VEPGEQADALILIKNDVETLLKGGKIVPAPIRCLGNRYSPLA
jgi:hypothetical protein